MRTVLAAILATTALSAGAAAADEVCGARTHMRFGETRAYFSDVLAACRPGGYCSVVGEVADPSRASAFRQQFRVARPSPGAPFEVHFAATDPMPASEPGPMQLALARTSFDFTDFRMAIAANEYRIADSAMAKSMVDELKRARTARWTYASESGPASATFPLNGLTAALTWIDCMGAQPK